MFFRYARTGILSIIVISFIAFSGILYYQPEEHSKPAAPTNKPDAYMEDVSTVIMGKEGRPTLKVFAPKVLHFAKDDTSHFINPTVTLYKNSPVPWYITSHFGIAQKGIELVQFIDNVVIHHASDGKNPATLIKTATLTIHPKDKTAETKDLITMLQPNLSVRAIGMHADLNTGNIILLSRARGIYVPAS